MIHASKVLVIVGSTRARRIGRDIADWVATVGAGAMTAEFEVVDLRDWPLPMDDEPLIPAAGDGYQNDHTRGWSAKIAEGDAFVFVTPQYNWGYPASLKNALDHLYQEWSGKPAIIVSYGSQGGGRCAAQLRQVLDGLRMKPAPTMPGLHLGRERVVDNAGAIDAAAALEAHLAELRQAFLELAEALGARQAAV
jgi:NAD(P)H-dependent FMN reductase